MPSAIDHRFNQIDIEVAAKRKATLIDGLNGRSNLSPIAKIDLPNPIDLSRLAMELTLFRDYTMDEEFMPAFRINHRKWIIIDFGLLKLSTVLPK